MAKLDYFKYEIVRHTKFLFMQSTVALLNGLVGVHVQVYVVRSNGKEPVHAQNPSLKMAAKTARELRKRQSCATCQRAMKEVRLSDKYSAVTVILQDITANMSGY